MGLEGYCRLAPTSAERNGPREFSRALAKVDDIICSITDDSDDEEGMRRKDPISEVLDRQMNIINSKWREVDLVGDPEARRKEGWYRMSVTIMWADCNTPLHMALFSQSFRSTTDLLLSRGADINIHNARRTTVLFRAISDDAVDEARFLLERGADPNVPTFSANPTCGFDYGYNTPFVGQGGRLALQEAISIPSRELCALLIDAGADVKLLLPGGWSFLDLAVLRRDKEIVRMLLVKGAIFSSLMSDTVHSSHTKGHHDSLDGINDIQRLARDLVASAWNSPPTQTRELFNLTVYSGKLTQLLDEVMDFQQKSTKLISAFHDNLSHLADTINPSRSPIPHCDRCTEFQSLPGSWNVLSEEEDWQWGNLETLLQSAASGCPLCLLLVDVINHASEESGEMLKLDQDIILSGEERRNGSGGSFAWTWSVLCGKTSGYITIDVLSG